ncbi:MAG: hypothetical protein K8J09_13350 [Planctomycetes bacterium]|nr:hypothetical protein [Planctomycetota bacterium]MCC7399753.1 hypothetical protein [Planctomycetota bacterium]
MRNVLTDILGQVRGIWSRLDGGQRLVVSAVLFATLAGLGGVVWFAGRPSYETVFVPKNGDDIGRVQQALQSEGITWTYGADNRSFMVERAKVGAANIAIAKAGLTGTQAPAIGGGTSLIEDSETKAYRLDMASIALARSAVLSSLEGVLDATVTASRPRRATAFRDREEEQKPTATIALKLRQGVAFDNIAASAADLVAAQLMVPLKNITVVSAAGSQRWRYDADRSGGGGSSDAFLALQQKLSDDRTMKAQERLDQLWPGKTSVAVTIELDPSWEVRSEKVLPDGKVVRSEKTSKDSTAGGGGAGGGNGGQAADASGRKNETLDREFVTEIGERRSGKMMPDIKRMSVALIYDASLAQSAAGFNAKDLENTVKAIVGWDATRDQTEAFSIMAGTFAPLEPEAPVEAGPGMLDKLQRWAPTIGQVLGVFVVVLFLRGMFKRVPKAAAAEAAPATAAKVEVDESTLPPEEQQKRMRREIERTIASDPAALAKLLEAWLMEQKA